jgi:SAM-dependent methyltransferase
MPDTSGDLRFAFDKVAVAYHNARPDYPQELFDALLEEARITTASRLLEVGCGTGKATLPLAIRGLAITAVEPGPALVEEACARLQAFPRVSIVNALFEEWARSTSERFDLVFAATAWHWIDPRTRYGLAGRVTSPGGQLAIWSATHVFPDDGDPFFDEIQQVYDEIGEGHPEGAPRPRPGHLPELSEEIDASGYFGDVKVSQFDWEVTYDADAYLALLDTFSGHIAMEPWQRERLYGEIRARLVARPTQTLRRHWGAALHVATRTTRPDRA